MAGGSSAALHHLELFEARNQHLCQMMGDFVVPVCRGDGAWHRMTAPDPTALGTTESETRRQPFTSNSSPSPCGCGYQDKVGRPVWGRQTNCIRLPARVFLLVAFVTSSVYNRVAWRLQSTQRDLWPGGGGVLRLVVMPGENIRYLGMYYKTRQCEGHNTHDANMNPKR